MPDTERHLVVRQTFPLTGHGVEHGRPEQLEVGHERCRQDGPPAQGAERTGAAGRPLKVPSPPIHAKVFYERAPEV